MSRITPILLTALCLALSASAAWAETPTKAEPVRTFLVFDRLNDPKLADKVADTKGADFVVEHVDSVAKLAERAIDIGCEKLAGVRALEEKDVDDTLSKLISDILEPCGTPLVEVNVLDMLAVEKWGQTGFNPFKQEAEKLSTPVLKIRGDLTMPGGGRGTFVISAGDTGTWVESWSVKSESIPSAQVDIPALDPACLPGAGSGEKRAEKSCDSGPWHSPPLYVCCWSQLLICSAINGIPFIGPALCPDCYGRCFEPCVDCVNNPCHSCDPCGLTWLLCRFVLGASC